MPKREIPMKSSYEFDALTTGGRRVHHWRAGMRAWAKRLFNKRVRREEKLRRETE